MSVIIDEQQQAIETLAKFFKRQGLKADATAQAPDIVKWAQRNYYIPETDAPIHFEPNQRAVLRYALDPNNDFTTIVYSTIKKSGKTAVAGVVGRYFAEFSGNKSEIYFMAHDKEQAKDRAYESAITSITMSPGFDASKNTLPGQWRIIEKQAYHLPTNSFMRAIASDYQGAAGGNPTVTLWTELWAFTGERFERLWDELTPVPTRKRSIRYVETYAGFEDESTILLNLYKQGVKEGKRLTHDDIDWPYPDQPPIYVNKAARLCVYWDEGEAARRMPWQRGARGDAYYKEQAATLRESAFRRFHLNQWVSRKEEFIPLIWWQNCRDIAPCATFNKSTHPFVLGVDASISGDCTAVVLAGRHPDPKLADDHVIVPHARVWFPPVNGTIDYKAVKDYITSLCNEYNVAQVAYDQYQLHQMMQELTREGVAWCKVFSQAGDREIADKQLYDLIRDRKLHHNSPFSDDFIANAASYTSLHEAKNSLSTNKVERLRIVKKAKDTPVDPVVAMSMAVAECLRLLLN